MKPLQLCSFAKGKFPLEWGSLPNCLVTKYVFVVIFINSVLPTPILVTRNPVGLRPGHGFEIRLTEVLLS